MTVGSYTVGEARDFIYQTFYQAWISDQTGWPSILTSGPPPADVIWDGLEPTDDTPTTQVEVYFAVRHSNGQQASLMGETGDSTTGRRWRRTGVATARMRFPVDMQLKTADLLAKVVSDAFQGKRGFGDGSGIWFPRVRLVEQGRNQERNRQDVLAYFEYDEIS